MSPDAIIALADFLDARAATVRALEAEAEALIHDSQDQPGYEAKMREKATLLAALAQDTRPLLPGLDPASAAAVSDRLEGFSGNAAMALRLGSVFFMYALLYPDEHQPGQPNNLELLAAEVRSWA